MSTGYLPLNDQLYSYLLNTSLREPELLKRLRAETANIPDGRMQISPEQGQFMQLLLKLMGATKTLEVGVFTGYSSLCTALALPDNGQIIACDVSEKCLKGVFNPLYKTRAFPREQSIEDLAQFLLCFRPF